MPRRRNGSISGEVDAWLTGIIAARGKMTLLGAASWRGAEAGAGAAAVSA